MKSFLIIGMGNFGYYLCRELSGLGNEILAVDIEEECLTPCLSMVTSAQIGDCTRPDVLKELGIGNFDRCFVCIGTNFQSSLEITSLLKEMGARWVVSRASTDVQAKFLLKNGADEVVYPERDIAERIAKKSSASHVFDFVDLGDYGIYEVLPLKSWVGKSIRELNLRKKGINIIARKGDLEDIVLIVDPDRIIEGQETFIIIGSNKDLERELL